MCVLHVHLCVSMCLSVCVFGTLCLCLHLCLCLCVCDQGSPKPVATSPIDSDNCVWATEYVDGQPILETGSILHLGSFFRFNI